MTEIKINNNFKVRNVPFSLSPTGDRKVQTPQSITFLNIFGIKDQNRNVKKSVENLKFTEEIKKKFREPQLITPSKNSNKEIKRETSKKNEFKRTENSQKTLKNDKIISKKIENTNILKTDKPLETKENEIMGSGAKIVQHEKEIKKDKYKPTKENLLKIFYYFRFHLHSFLINCGKREKIEEINQANAIQTFLPSIKKTDSLHLEVSLFFFVFYLIK